MALRCQQSRLWVSRSSAAGALTPGPGVSKRTVGPALAALQAVGAEAVGGVRPRPQHAALMGHPCPPVSRRPVLWLWLCQVKLSAAVTQTLGALGWARRPPLPLLVP